VRFLIDIAGKTVYVLGAGASQHTGAPLLRDFLVSARNLFETEGELHYRESFERVFQWLDSLRGSSEYLDFERDNLEHVFSVAEMKKQLGLEGGEELASDLRYVIMETLDKRCHTQWLRDKFQPDELYSKFSESLKTLNEGRRERTSQASEEFENDVVISFNYDVLLDYAMQLKRLNLDYSLDAASQGRGEAFRILKLHGSTNWAFCSKCKKNPLQIVRASPIAKGCRPGGFMAEGRNYPFGMVTEVLLNTKCTKCNEIGGLEPVVIPPTWSKTVDGTPIAQVWASAVREIKKAFQIVIIGYSLPPTDTFLQYLVTLGLASNPNLHRVVVVDKDSSDEFRTRYKTVFSRSLSDRGRLTFLTGKTFERYVAEYMRGVGSRIQ